jgi:hypothetical protein
LSALKPSHQAERLKVVQRAARHLLDALSQGGFGTMDIFPDDLPACQSATSEYTWRGQLAWVWARAGYLEQKLAGQGLNKHWVYKLRSQGRPALERIASEPVVASYYISTKRPTSAGTEYPQSHYQPPELRGLVLESVPKVDLTAARKERSGTRPQLLDDDLSDAHVSSEDDGSNESVEDGDGGEVSDVAGDAGEGGGSGDGGTQGLAQEYGLLGVYIEQSTKVLEAMHTGIADCRDEVKAQTDALLEVAGRIEQGASKADVKMSVGAASAEIVQALVQRKDDGASPAVLRAVESVDGKVGGKIDAARDAIIAACAFDKGELAGLIYSALAPVLEKAVEEAVTKSVAQRVESIRDKIAAGVEKIVAGRMDDLEKSVGKALSSQEKSLVSAVRGEGDEMRADLEESVRDLREAVDALEARLAAVDFDAEAISDLREGVEGLDAHLTTLTKKFFDGYDKFSEQGKKNLEGWKSMHEATVALLEASKIVGREILALAVDRADMSGVPRDAVTDRSTEAVNRLSAALDGVRGVSALGGGLIRSYEGSDVRPIIRSTKAEPNGAGEDAGEDEEKDGSEEDEEGEEASQ